MNLDIRISRAIVHAVSQYTMPRRTFWLQRMVRARMKQARLRRLPIG